jgi:Ran GTPase-activating protein (RanGAP) involved in mRNA processing and transport
MTKFDISSNGIQAEGGKTLAAGLKGNQIITGLNIANNDLGTNFKGGTDMSGVIALADVISDMGALTKLDISSNIIGAEGGKLIAAALKGNQVMTVLNISGNYLAEDSNDKPDMSGVIALADVIPDMGALSILNLASNSLGEIVLAEGWSYDVYNASYKHADGHKQKEKPGKPEGIIAIANAIPDMGALAKLDISRNHIGAEQERDLQRICMTSGIAVTT